MLKNELYATMVNVMTQDAIKEAIMKAGNLAETDYIALVKFLDGDAGRAKAAREKSVTTKTAKQKLNDNVKEVIKAVMFDMAKPMTVSDLRTDARLEQYSVAKLSALCSQLVHAGEVTRTEIKGRALFELNVQ